MIEIYTIAGIVVVLVAIITRAAYAKGYCDAAKRMREIMLDHEEKMDDLWEKAMEIKTSQPMYSIPIEEEIE